MWLVTASRSTPALDFRFSLRNARSGATTTTRWSNPVNRACWLHLGASYTRRRFSGKALRLCVRTLTVFCRLPPSQPLPSTPSLPSRVSSELWTGPIPNLSPAPCDGCSLHIVPIFVCRLEAVGPPGFRRWTFMRDATCDPGGA
jgi:hypothetical protein